VAKCFGTTSVLKKDVSVSAALQEQHYRIVLKKMIVAQLAEALPSFKGYKCSRPSNPILLKLNAVHTFITCVFKIAIPILGIIRLGLCDKNVTYMHCPLFPRVLRVLKLITVITLRSPVCAALRMRTTDF
jgi:hypothetical protein